MDGILGTGGRRPWVNSLRGKILYLPVKRPPLFVSMMQSLLKEPRGLERFVHRYTTHMQTTLSRARLLRVIDNKQAILAPEMARHIARWQPTENSNQQSALPLRNSDDWLAEVKVLRDYAEARHEHVWVDLQTSFKLGAPAMLQVGDVPGLLGVEVERGCLNLLPHDKRCYRSRRIDQKKAALSQACQTKAMKYSTPPRPARAARQPMPSA